MVSLVYNGIVETYARRPMERQQLLQRVEAMRDDGKTIRAIASALGVHRSRVYRAVKALAAGAAGDNLPTSPLSSVDTGLSSAPEAEERGLTSVLSLGEGSPYFPLRSGT